MAAKSRSNVQTSLAGAPTIVLSVICGMSASWWVGCPAFSRGCSQRGLGRRAQDRDAAPGGGLGERGEVRWSGGWRGQREGLGGLTGLGGELLEPGRAVQGEEPCSCRRDDVSVAKAAGQYRDGAWPGGVLLLAGEYAEFAVEHEEGLV